MKFYPAVLLALLASTFSALAQVEVEVVLDQDKYLPAEQLLAGVRIVNRSGQELNLGEDVDWATFSIERIGGGVVHLISQPPMQGVFKLKSSARATVKVDIAPCYDLRQQGRYLITATVKIKEWDKVLLTKPVPLEIVEGTKLWEQAFGVPQPGGTQPPEVRKYTLQQANYLKSLRLYLRVSTADARVLKLLNVGPMIGFGQPEPQVDQESRLHLLYQNAAKTFNYLIVNPDGDIVQRQTYEYSDTRPRLRSDEGGRIMVTGGMRRPAADDLPVVVKSKDDGKEITP